LCNVTLTPPITTDPVIKVAPVTTVILNVPATSEMDAAGIARLDNQDPAFPGSYALWAGSTASVKNGSQWSDSLTTPPLFPPQPNDAGTWAHLQIITASGTATAAPGGTSKSLGTGVASLDGGFPYAKSGGYFPDNGTSEPEGDSPGVGLDDGYTEFSPNYTFDTYVMYAPPGADTVFVPITKLHWTWTADVTKPNSGWESWPIGTSPSGTLAVPSAGTSWTTEPQWTNVVAGQH
jgi:hypothetical protein